MLSLFVFLGPLGLGVALALALATWYVTDQWVWLYW